MNTEDVRGTQKDKDHVRERDGQQLGVGLFTLFQGEIEVGRVLVVEEGSDMVEHWDLWTTFRQPSWANRDQGIQFLYTGEPTKLEEFRADGIAFNALWPRTGIATAAIQFALAGEEGMKSCRTVEIMADAAHAIFEKPAKDFTGNFLIDDSFLYAEGERDFDKYRVDPSAKLMPDFFVPADSVPPPGVVIG